MSDPLPPLSLSPFSGVPEDVHAGRCVSDRVGSEPAAGALGPGPAAAPTQAQTQAQDHQPEQRGRAADPTGPPVGAVPRRGPRRQPRQAFTHSLLLCVCLSSLFVFFVCLSSECVCVCVFGFFLRTKLCYFVHLFGRCLDQEMDQEICTVPIQ